MKYKINISLICALVVFFLQYAISAYCKNIVKATTENTSAWHSHSVTPTIVGDTALMDKYQTFDEMTMKGVGAPIRNPFVYVKEQGDSVYVISSCKQDSMRLYVKLATGGWFNRLAYNKWKVPFSLVEKKYKYLTQDRVYERYILNDTIIEVLRCRDFPPKVYVKSQGCVWIIDSIEDTHLESISLLRIYIQQFLQKEYNKNCRFYLVQCDDRYELRKDDNKVKATYLSSALGYWGIQPGIEETALFCGIDIRHYYDGQKQFQEDNPNHIFEVVDTLPTYHGGVKAIIKYLNSNRKAPCISGKHPQRVLIRFVVEKDGTLSNIEVVKSLDQIHDKDALSIMYRMPKWKPAKLNGKNVRCRMVIPVSYKM